MPDDAGRSLYQRPSLVHEDCAHEQHSKVSYHEACATRTAKNSTQSPSLSHVACAEETQRDALYTRLLFGTRSSCSRTKKKVFYARLRMESAAIWRITETSQFSSCVDKLICVLLIFILEEAFRWCCTKTKLSNPTHVIYVLDTRHCLEHNGCKKYKMFDISDEHSAHLSTLDISDTDESNRHRANSVVKRTRVWPSSALLLRNTLFSSQDFLGVAQLPRLSADK